MYNKAIILDIAMNLNRIGNWAADDYEAKKKQIELFLTQTSKYIKNIDEKRLSTKFKPTFVRFLKEFKMLNNSSFNDKLLWAEKMMTWGNILTHRSKLL